jgi:CHASE2 domain-containing sensor protein
MGIRPRLGGLIAALLMAATLQAIGPERVRRPVFDAWQRLAPRDLTYTPVRIIWIDDASIRKLGAWPWSRYLMARLTERIATGRPKVIGYDMLFSEPDRARPETFAALYPELDGATAQKVRALPSMDHVFAQVIGQSMVVLGRAGIDAPPLATSPALAVEARIPKPLPKSVQGWGQALANIPEIDDVAIGHGLLNGERDGDGVVRRVPLVGRAAALDMPGFALELARIAKGEQALAPVGGAVLSGIQLGKASLPVSPEGRMAFRFGALPKTSQVSALDILDGTIGQAALKDKIVIVGLSGAGTADLVATPLSPGVYGSVVQAEAVDAILGGGALERPGWAVWMELICAVLLVGLAVRLLPRLSPLSGAGVALGALGLLMGGSLLAFSRAGLLIDPLSPLLTAAAAATAMFALMFGESRRLVEQQRLSAARASGELAAARTIQLGMLPTRASLATLHPRVAVDALIEPARSVGGDFFEAIPIGPHHLCLLVGDVTGKGIPAALFMALSKARIWAPPSPA